MFILIFLVLPLRALSTALPTLRSSPWRVVGIPVARATLVLSPEMPTARLRENESPFMVVCMGRLFLALAGDAVFAGVYLPLDALDSTVVRGGMVNLRLAVHCFAGGGGGALDHIGIMLVVAFLDFFFFCEAGTQVHHLLFVIL